jgi:cell wall-associated NlpC family hydrolase
VRRIQYVTEIGTRDADLLGQVTNDKTRLEDTIAQLKTDEADSASLEFELEARNIEITERNEERQKLLKKQNASLLSLVDAQQTAAVAEERQLAAKIELGQYKDITVAQGSPVETALAYRGIPYVWGGESKSGMDCSGLVLFVFRQHGVKLPHYSGAQFNMGKPVSGTLTPGDVVFFGSPIHHVGIYIGGDRYIHAPRTGDVVKISQLSSRRDFAGARRYNWTIRTEPIR